MLDEPHGIVAQVSHRPARKPRKATYADLRVPIELSLNGLENVTPNRSPAFSILDLHIHAPRAKDFIRILTEERISSQLLTALDTLQQKAVRASLAKCQKSRHRRQQVSTKPSEYGHYKPCDALLEPLFYEAFELVEGQC